MNIDALKSLLTVEDSAVEVTIKMGWKTIAMFEEQHGRWWISVGGKEIGRELGYSSKEKALEGLLAYFQLDDQN